MDVIFDLDWTLADPSHRMHHIQKAPKDWDAFFAAQPDDLAIRRMAALARSLVKDNSIIICTGRPSDTRDITQNWLNTRIWTPVGKRNVAMYMREKGDRRQDDVVKSELYDKMLRDGYFPTLVFEDRRRCVGMWRQRGLLCCQVADGDF